MCAQSQVLQATISRLDTTPFFQSQLTCLSHRLLQQCRTDACACMTAHHVRESRTNVSTHMGTAAVCTATTQQPSTPLDVRCWVHKQPAEESVPDAHTQKECLAVLLCAVTCATHQHKANPAAGCSMPLTPLLLLASECLPGLRLSHAPPHLRRWPHRRPSNVGVNTLYSDSEAVTINKSINSQTECNRYKACLRACVHKTDTHIPHHTHS